MKHPEWWQKVVHEHEDREKWLTARSRFACTASEVAVVLQEGHGKHPITTREELAARKRGEGEPFEQNSAMRWGTLFEPLILSQLQALWPDDEYEAFGWLCADVAQPLLGGTPDALKVHEGELIPVQIKSTAYFPKTLLEKGIPMPWQLQVQAECAVLGTQACELAVLHLTKRELQRYLVPRDQQMIDVIRSAAETFFHDFIKGGDDGKVSM